VTARAVEEEIDAGCVPSGLSADGGRLRVALAHPGTAHGLSFSVKTDGAAAGTVFRMVDDRVADFGDGRPAVRGPGLVRHVEPEGVELPAAWRPAGDAAAYGL